LGATWRWPRVSAAQWRFMDEVVTPAFPRA
jgi:hypothetical protein